MAGYVWKGTPEPPKPRRPAWPPAGKYCGTRSGYEVHRKGKETPCQPCKDAENAYSREYRARIRQGMTPATTFSTDACGTRAGYRRHLRHHVPACAPCKAANTEYSLRWSDHRKAKRAAARARKQQ